MKRKIPTVADENENNVRKKILAVLAAGAVLMVADLAVSASAPRVKMTEHDGVYYMTRPAEGEEAGRLTLNAIVTGDGETVEKEMGVVLEPYGKETGEDEEGGDGDEETMSRQERVERELRSIVSDLNSDTEKVQVKLPDRLETGERVSWEAESGTGSNAPIIVVLTGLVAFVVYRNRFAALEREKKEAAASVMRQLPEFVNRLVLLLNAGLVLTNAFEKTVEETFSFRDDGDYFYGRLKEIYISCRTANGSMHVEFRKMAKESGIRELMRVSNIITDNVRKGTELTGKLQSESEMLWLERKKSCEERGRLAETKLTLPLMIFLLVLIVITVAPALLEL